MDSGAVEAVSKAGISDGMVRRPLSQLEAKRLVRSSKLGRIKVFRGLVDIPKKSSLIGVRNLGKWFPPKRR